MHNPAKLDGITMRYVDALPVAKLREMHPELNELPLVEPSILDTAGERHRDGVVVLVANVGSP